MFISWAVPESSTSQVISPQCLKMVSCKLALILACAVLLQTAMAKRGSTGRDRKGRQKLGGASSELDDIKEQLEELQERMKAGGGCGGGKVHMYFHSGDDHHEHGMSDDDDEQHVHLHIHHDDGPHAGFDDLDIDHFEGEGGEEIDAEHSAHCQFNDKGVHGHAHWVQKDNDDHANVHFGFDLLGAPNTDFAVHVHEFGDLSKGCSSLGGHYDPYDDAVDVGDLGVLRTNKEGGVDGVWKNNTALTLFSRYSIIGRSMAIHDDKQTIGCCLIGRMPVIDHVHHEDDSGHHHSHGVHIEHYGKVDHSAHAHHMDHGHH